MSALSKLNSLHIRVGELADYICISEWVTVICYTCKKTQSVQLFILDMWVKMQKKKKRQGGMAFLWDGFERISLSLDEDGIRGEKTRTEETNK